MDVNVLSSLGKKYFIRAEVKESIVSLKKSAVKVDSQAHNICISIQIKSLNKNWAKIGKEFQNSAAIVTNSSRWGERLFRQVQRVPGEAGVWKEGTHHLAGSFCISVLRVYRP